MRRFAVYCWVGFHDNSDEEWFEHHYINASTPQEAYDTFRYTPFHIPKGMYADFSHQMMDTASKEVFYINANTDQVFSTEEDWVDSYPEDIGQQLYLHDVLTIVYE